VIELDWLNGVAGVLFEQDGRLHMVDMSVLRTMNPGLKGGGPVAGHFGTDRLAGMRM
jgi:hypothetical protein